MYYGLVALLTRALRVDARQLRNHLFRLTFVGFIYICLLWASLTSGFFGAPGLLFFTQIAWLNVLFITCAGIGFFSSAITEEKEEDTIGLLQMAGLNHLGILLGKSTSRLIQVMFLLVVQFPFMLLAVTLGGVTTHQLFAAYVDLVAFTILLANTALVCSVIFQRGGTAAGFTTLMMVLYAVAPGFAAMGLAELAAAGWAKSVWWKSLILTSLEWLQDSCLFWQLNEVMATGFNQPILTRQVISNVVAGILCFGLAWLLFGPAVNHAAAGGSTRGIVVRSTSRLKLLSPGRCWSNPFIWKDFQFIGGGYLLLVGKFACYVGLFFLLVVISILDKDGKWLGANYSNNPMDFTGIFVSGMSIALILEACLYSSRIFHDEIRLQTMSSLLMLPRSIPYIGYSKALGCLLGLLPAIVCLVGGLLMLPGIRGDNLLSIALDARLWAAVMGFLIFFHLIALLSLFVKWGALPLALFLVGPISTCCPVWQLVMVAVGPNGVQDLWGKLPATITVWILTGLVCFVFQMMIAARLQELGTK